MNDTGQDIGRLLRQLLVVCIAVVVAAAVAFGISSLAPKFYTAQAMLVVSAGLGTDPSANADVLTAPRIAQTYASLATTRSMLNQVIATAHLTTDSTSLARLIKVSVDPASPFIAISVTDPDPARAELTANALADALVKAATVAATVDRPEFEILEIVERAIAPDEPSGPRVLFNSVLAGATALVLTIVVLAGLAYYRGIRAAPTARTG